MISEDVALAVYGTTPGQAPVKLREEISQYFQIPYDLAARWLGASSHMMVGAWVHANPKTKEDIFEFYHRTPLNIFASAHYWLARQGESAPEIAAQLEGCSAVLDFGGGCGEMSIYLRSKGFNMTYVDLGRTFEFAHWRVGCRGITDIELWKNDPVFPLPRARFDAVLCLDVIEHCPDVPATLDTLASYLKQGGILIANFPECDDDTQPFHLPGNEQYRKEWGQMLKDRGFDNEAGRSVYHGTL